jgi:hypothetical protein
MMCICTIRDEPLRMAPSALVTSGRRQLQVLAVPQPYSISSNPCLGAIPVQAGAGLHPAPRWMLRLFEATLRAWGQPRKQ